MSKIFAVAALVGAAGFASANMVDLVVVDNGGLLPGFTYDLVVTVDAGDDWTSASIMGDTDGVFYQDAVGGDAEPNSALFGVFPELEFDSFFANPPALFDGSNPGFADGPVWTDSTVTATWFDTNTDDLGGTYTIARFTTDSVDGYLHVEGAMTYALTGGQLFDYSITVPAPASIALLGLAGLIRRR
jgi:hypothetical protein